MSALRHRRPAARGGVKLIILLLLAALLGAAVGYFGLARRAGADGKTPAREKKAAEAKAKQAAEEAQVTHVDMGAFLVNLGAPDMVRYLRTEITLGIRGLTPPAGKGGHDGGGDGAALPHALDARVRDAVVRVLSAQSFEDLRTRGPDEALKQAILDELKGCMDKERPVTVLFTSFVMQ